MQYLRLTAILIISLILAAGCKAQDQSQVLRSTKDLSGLRITLELPKEKYVVGKEYIAEATLINSGNGPIKNITKAELMVVVYSKNGKAFSQDEQPAMVELNASSTPSKQSFSAKYLLKFKEPGTYEVDCYISSIAAPGVDWRRHRPIGLRPEPIRITVK